MERQRKGKFLRPITEQSEAKPTNLKKLSTLNWKLLTNLVSLCLFEKHEYQGVTMMIVMKQLMFNRSIPNDILERILLLLLLLLLLL